MRIHTLTCNLLAETTYTFPTWRMGVTQRAGEETFQVGGKGINVTRMLRRLGLDSVAWLFSGGATGRRCETWLQDKGIPCQVFPTPAETRTGTVVRAAEIAETTFLGAENVIAASAIQACATSLDRQEPGDLLVIAGSIPAWEDRSWDPLRDAVRKWLQRGLLVVDTYGPALRWFAGLPAALIKINRREFSGLAGVTEAETTDDRMAELLTATAQRSSAAAWAITGGSRPVWFCLRSEKPESVVPPTIRKISATGSGDVFTAGLLFARYHRCMELSDAVRLALPLAAANAAHPGVAAFDLTPFEDLVSARPGLR